MTARFHPRENVSRADEELAAQIADAPAPFRRTEPWDEIDFSSAVNHHQLVRQLVLPVVFALLVLAGVLAALGCGGGGEEATSSNCKPVSAPLKGTWTMTINPNELPPELATLQGGRFDMTFGPGHEHAVTPPNGNEFSYGPVCIDGAHIQFSEPPVGGVCTGSGKSVYRWEVVNDRLILETVEDECVLREVFLVAQAWRAVPS